MTVFRQHSLVLTVAILGMTLPGQAFSAPAIRDQANLLSADGRAWAETAIQNLSREYHVNVVIETFSRAPWLAKVWHNTPEARARYSADWAKSRAKKAGPSGIYILICTDPGWPQQVTVEVGRDINVFGPAEIAKLQQLVQASLGVSTKRGPGIALSAPLRMIQVTFEAKLGGWPFYQEPFPWLDVLWIMLIMVAFWFAVEVIHKLALGTLPDDRATLASNVSAAGSLAGPLFASVTNHSVGEFLRSEFWNPRGVPATNGEATPTSELIESPAGAPDRVTATYIAGKPRGLTGVPPQDPAHGPT